MWPTSDRWPGRSRRRAVAAGAELALTYQGERLEENVRELAATLGRPSLIVPCDVAIDEQIDALFAAVGRELGGLDFVVHGAAFAPREALSAPFVDTTREAFRTTLDISAYSLVALARGAKPLMTNGGSILTLTYLGAARVLVELQRHGRRESRARGHGPLPRGRPRSAEHPRQRHLRRSR